MIIVSLFKEVNKCSKMLISHMVLYGIRLHTNIHINIHIHLGALLTQHLHFPSYLKN